MAWQHIALGVFFALVIPAGAPQVRQESLPHEEERSAHRCVRHAGRRRSSP